MRRINSEFQTRHLSEEGQKLTNRDYFGFVEMDDYACYVLADSLDEDMEASSARLVVESLIRSFVEKPTMGKRILNGYMHQAHRELTKERSGMRLKASVVMVITDYRKVRFCQTGNSRFYLIRNGRYLEQSHDQSLTRNLIEEERLSMDQAALHEERNNLYSYMGVRGKLDVVISPKIRLEDGDILAQLTRGVWENCSDGELLQAANDAKEPQDILNRAEDQILGRQEDVTEIDNYSLAVTLVSKVYQSPKKRLTFKKVLMIVIPVLIVICAISIAFYLRYRSVKNKEYQLDQYMESGEQYLRYDNYKKAAEEYTEAKKLATSLKRSDDVTEADQYLKLTDQIILADEALLAGEHVKAQELYLSARELSVNSGNVGKKYIDLQLDQTKDYIEVYDLITAGEIKEANGDITGAIEAYHQAKEKAAALYAREAKEEALKKQTAAEQKQSSAKQAEEAEEASARKEAQAAREQQEAEQKAAEEKEKESQAAELELQNQQKANDQKNAIELENKGNELMAAGQYQQAITFYRTAQSIYERLEMYSLVISLEDKKDAAQAGIDAIRESEAAAAAETKDPKLAGPGQ